MTALLLPGLLAVAASLTAAGVHRRLRPSVAAPVLALVSVATALSVAWSLALLAVGFVAHLAWAADLRAWCQVLGVAHDAVPPAAGILSTVGLLVMAAAFVRAIRRLPSIPLPVADSELVVLPTTEPTAYAVPGRPGHIVVSAGMLRALDDDERDVLLAHERAHLRHRHHLYLRVVDVAVSAVPTLRPLAARVRFATERWADEDAAAQVGDRHVVARAIAQAALVSASFPAPALALSGLGVPARVEALLDDRGVGLRASAALALVTVIALLTVAGSTIQLHHLLAFATELCIVR